MRGFLLGAALALAGCHDDAGAIRPVTGGDVERGRALALAVGCPACHSIPGVRAAGGVVGPPLGGLALRTYVAGHPNTPDNLVRWLRSPHEVRPDAAMPELGLTEEEARDVAAFLYTLD